VTSTSVYHFQGIMHVKSLNIGTESIYRSGPCCD